MIRIMKVTLLAVALIVALAGPAAAHEQKFMGTVSAIEGVHVHITTTDKKDVMVMLHEKTKILRGKESQRPKDIQVGDRIFVITTDGKHDGGKPILMANQVRLGTAGMTKK